jgi:hypothetical protein
MISSPLRDMGAWIPPGTEFPQGSVSARVRAGEVCEGAEEIAADNWFNDWNRGLTLLEEARHLGQWDQTLTLLWFEDEETLPPTRSWREEKEDLGLRELDGILPWPGRKRRK